MSTVAVYGSINWDEICQLPRYPEPHEKMEALAIHSTLGGSAANTASWLSTGVERVELVGAVGDDAEGGLCIDWVRRLGIGYSCVEAITQAPTSRASCWVVGSEKRIVTHRQPLILREHAPAASLEVVARVAHLHLGSLIDGAALECLAAAQAAGATISVELSGKPHDAARKHADVVFLNTVELGAIFGLTVAELTAETRRRVAPRLGATLVVTDGPQGIHCATAQGVRSFPVAALRDVVDRTGGGDSFDGGFIAGWLESSGSLEAGVASGLACSRQALRQVGGARRPA